MKTFNLTEKQKQSFIKEFISGSIDFPDLPDFPELFSADFMSKPDFAEQDKYEWEMA